MNRVQRCFKSFRPVVGLSNDHRERKFDSRQRFATALCKLRLRTFDGAPLLASIVPGWSKSPAGDLFARLSRDSDSVRAVACTHAPRRDALVGTGLQKASCDRKPENRGTARRLRARDIHLAKITIRCRFNPAWLQREDGKTPLRHKTVRRAIDCCKTRKLAVPGLEGSVIKPKDVSARTPQTANRFVKVGASGSHESPQRDDTSRVIRTKTCPSWTVAACCRRHQL